MAMGKFRRGFGSSSAKCEVQSGVPIANAPFSIPKQKTKPSFVQPVPLDHSFQTKEEDAYSELVKLGVIAQARIVMISPPRTEMRPALVMAGSWVLKNITVKQQLQFMMINAMKTFHGCGEKSG